MTDKQHIALVEVGDEFDLEFSKLVARCLDKLPRGMDETDVIYYLQDKTSIYGSSFREHMSKSSVPK